MNLENPNKGIDYIHYTSGEQLCAEREFKAGWNACLEALKKEGIEMVVTKSGVLPIVPESMPYLLSLVTCGKLVFIPEEV